MVISTFVRKYIFVYLYLFSHNLKVNICINLYFISVWELTNTLSQYIQATKYIDMTAPLFFASWVGPQEGLLLLEWCVVMLCYVYYP